VISLSFDGVRSEVLLHALEEKGIYVSAGSACSSNRPHVSGTLTEIGVPKEHLDSTIRFSTSVMNTPEDMTAAADALKELLPFLRKYTRH
jgi:cysteine desulfurase